MTQAEKATLFKSLHVPGDPLILFNIWDAGSALAVQDIGAKALATGSWSVAAAHGFGDGEKIPFELVIANIQRIVNSVALPVTLDLEGGYSRQPDNLAANIRQVLEAGAVGINFEDQIVGESGLYEIEEQSRRIAAIRRTADEVGIPFFINARTDIFLKTPVAEHNAARLEEAIQRAKAYASVGADGFFAPGLRQPDLIRQLCEQSPLPVNILALADTPSTGDMAACGVARISYGASPYRQMIAALKEAAQKALAG